LNKLVELVQMKIALIAYNGNEIDIIIQRHHTEISFVF